MKTSVHIVAVLLALLASACSLPPERAVTKEELYSTSIYNYYVIKDSPESVLNALNREGEVVLEAKYKETPVYLKITATAGGLKVSVFER
ncbi:MAG TPA: hypothetical protein VI389_05205 [Geobacteraceae bacterium]